MKIKRFCDVKYQLLVNLTLPIVNLKMGNDKFTFIWPTTADEKSIKLIT